MFTYRKTLNVPEMPWAQALSSPGGPLGTGLLKGNLSCPQSGQSNRSFQYRLPGSSLPKAEIFVLSDKTMLFTVA